MIIRRLGLDLNLTELRGQLRRSFVHDLRSNAQALVPHAKGGALWLPDEVALRFFGGLTISYKNAANEARQVYNEQRSGEEPQWSELERRGLIRECAGRVWVTDLGEHLARTQSMPALLELHKTRFTEIYAIDDAVRRNPELAAVVAAIDAKTASPFDVGCQSPGWVAARLWESVADNATQDGLLQWLAKWHDLGSPSITPLSVWSPETTSRFIDAALDAIEANLPDDGWSLLHEDIIRRNPSFATRIAPVAQTPLDRLAWLERLQYTHDRISEDSLILYLVGAVLHQIAAVEHAGVPYAHADRLFRLALGRPAVLHAIASWCSSLPVLLADLAVNPSLCALACALIGERANHWVNTMSFAIADDSDRDRENAFGDAVTILSFLYEKDRVTVVNVASLFTWLFREHGADFTERRGPLLRRLRRVVEELPPERVQALVAALEGAGEFVLATPAYVAALEILSAHSITNPHEPALFLDGYVDALRRADYGLSVRHISEGAAAVIVRLAAASNAGSPVLGPPVGLFTLTPPDDPEPSEYAEEARRARAVRAHVRILCRALGRVEGDFRNSALDALIRTIRYGARSKGNGGTVGAFAARYEGFPQADNDRPCAQDLASALDVTKDDDRARLFEEILEIDEPYTLAQLYTLVRPELRTRLAERLLRLNPNEAAPISSYPEMQLRIDALLNAGLVEQAQMFVDAERDVQTLGRVQHRNREQFTYKLRLALLHADWQAIYSARVPDDVEGIDLQPAQESLAFFCGVANLLDPDGHPERAEQTFQDLSWRNPHIPAYAHNFLVARVRKLYGDDLFAILPEERRDGARTAFADAERALASLSVSDADQDRIDGYRGLILLGLKEPERAIDLLGPRLVATENSYLAAVVAVGQHRLGQDVEAARTLAVARERFGETDILRAAQAAVGNEARVVVRPEPAQSDDRLRAISGAVREFRNLDPHQQARALNESHSLSDLVVAIVREAGVGLEELVPGFPTTTWNEREYNKLLHKLVRARVSIFNWSVSEESPGGYAATGASGRRDIIITCGVATYVVIEGVVVKRSVRQAWTKGILRQHFVKLFGYAACDVFVHVTYAEIADRNEIIPLLQASAREDAPDGFTYVEARPLPNLGSSPPGFVAKYTDGVREISVAFVVLDVYQGRMAGAAKAAGQLDPRSKAKSKKTTSGNELTAEKAQPKTSGSKKTATLP